MIDLQVVKPLPPSRPKQNFFWQSLLKLGTYFTLSLFLLQGLTKAASLPVPMNADWGPTTYSLAGAAAAIVSNHDSFLTNPAGIFYYSGQTSLGGMWEKMPGKLSNWSASVVDGSNDIVGGFQFADTNANGLIRQNYTLDTAYKTPYGAIGVSIHGVRLRGVEPGRGWHLTNSVGVIVPLGGIVTLGIYSKSPYDLEKDHYFPPSIHMGVMYSKEGALRATFETGRRFRIEDQDWYYAVAGDILMQKYLAIRGGYRWDHEQGKSFWSMGGALLAPKIEMTGTYIRTTTGPKSNGYGFDVTFRF
ncbi:MAG: hypothetical protein JWQ35_39 [Bacteriovoracaceae bacterium]|nr:hypothetical protein [Bacteriovoracaceae bacterium]